MEKFSQFYLDNEKDIVVELYKEDDRLFYVLRTPNHNSGNLITNLAKLCELPIEYDENNLKIIKGEVPCYIDAQNREIYIFRLANTKVANIFPDGTIEMKAAIPALPKTLMSQTKDYKLDANKTIIKTYVIRDYKFETDLHTHMNGNLHPDILIALGIIHQIRYPLYYIKKLNLKLSEHQQRSMNLQRSRVEKQFVDSPLTGKYLIRKIDDNTFINFADLILNNLENAEENIIKIRSSLSILKDGQAVFTNLEKVYLYRYVFTKARESEKKIRLSNLRKIPDDDIVAYLTQMQKDRKNEHYEHNTVLQDKLLWIARSYQRQGIKYVEITDTTLVKKYESIEMLKQVHEVMPQIFEDTGVVIRFLAGIRRIPLTILKDNVTPQTYLQENLQVLRATALDPYVVGSDFIGEEINDINELKPVIKEIVKIAKDDPYFIMRFHAGENDSLKDNVLHSIQCVRSSLAPGQKMPRIRIGHGIYTANLDSLEGKRLLRMLKQYNVVLEFQITSNVRLNNLNDLNVHPLKQYLKAGVLCVQGTDGAALYGTNSIDEQLSLERMLELKYDDLMQMKRTDQRIFRVSMEGFRQKTARFNEMLADQRFEDVLIEKMNSEKPLEEILWKHNNIFDANTNLKDKIEDLPWDKYPIVLAGGSFNTDKRSTVMTAQGKKVIDSLLRQLNCEEVFFVIGHSLQGYERYLVDHNRHFKIFAMVPAMLSSADLKRLKKARVSIRVSTESIAQGIYKSITYEIFSRRPSILIGFDGNSAGVNLMQEAKNAASKSKIFIYDADTNLRTKAMSLEGYVKLFDGESHLAEQINEIIHS